MIKKRWLAEAFTWKISSTIIGVLCVWFATGDLLKFGGLYMASYVPASTIWYVIHKKLWSNWKRRQYEKAEAQDEYDEC